LNRFISRSAERNLLFFEILKSAEVFQWDPAQQKAFEELNQYLIDLTTLTPPAPGAPLLLYVARTGHSGIPENSGRNFWVLKNSGIQQSNPNLTRFFGYPKIRVLKKSGSGSGNLQLPE
jgi:hypothetical protein